VAHPFVIILNSFGGRLSTPAKIARVEQGMRAAGLEFELLQTESPGHAIELARRVAQRGQTIVAAGGDGTINEVVNGLILAAGGPPDCVVGILPLGTANDLAHSLGLPTAITAACQRLAAGHTRPIDVGQVNGRYFVNNSAIGLEPVVTLAQNRLRWIKGAPRYVAAALKCVFTAKPWQVSLSWGRSSFAGPIMLVSVGNGRRTGGAFYLTPHAQLDDGRLDVVYAMQMNRLQMLALLPQTFWGGHINHRLVGTARAAALTLAVSPPTPIQADGEVFETGATAITYQIWPGYVRVIV